MPFAREEEMYDILANWLKNRETNPCEETIVDKKESWRYTFPFGGKRHRVDVIGVYELEESVKFVGIEAKLSPKQVQSATRQALPLHSFCHEVYVAVPEFAFRQLTSTQQGELRAQLQRSYTGLLLVRETGKQRVIAEVPIEPIPFSLALHKKAEEHFRWDFDQEELLEVFRTKVGKRGLGWLRDDWSWDYDKNYDYFWKHKDQGRVSFRNYSIDIEIEVNSEKLLCGVANTFWSLAVELNPLDVWVEKARSLVKDDELESLPVLSIGGETGEEDGTAIIDIDAIDHDTLPSICTLVRTMMHPAVRLMAELPRPMVLKPKKDHEDFIDTIRLVYNILLKIASILESLSE